MRIRAYPAATTTLLTIGALGIGDFIEDGAAESPVSAATNEMLKEKIEQVLHTLSFREREIIKLRYGIGTGYTYTLEGLDAFRDIYERTFGGELPPYEVLYDPNLEFVQELGIASNLATPTTLLVDEDGIVRYAYVGKHIADRPAVKDVLDAVGDLE